ncbi:CaiB/BaiF CoA transferase family protein [Desulfatiglans anilini]|uniref:CaiB/BaiF CoA transferase family protein n=1 Tax=Desulfatiglans anilini TaxID=90728 RepID=UPI0004895FF7|nr:CaiB/BaiF CoA-transferase family protein [Desulfatiglans anilini]
MALPLDGIAILDLTRLIPGPFSTLILADLGAEVVKIEPLIVGDYERQIGPFQNGMGYRFMLLNRNKRSIALNLKESAGREIFMRMVQSSDVVIEGFRPGVMENLGLGYNDLNKINEKIIYCSISSYGHTGPYREKVAHDINILAVTGLLDLIGAPGGRPVIPGVQLVDAVTALYAVIGIEAALAEREKTGYGQEIDLSMQDCCFSLMFDSVRYEMSNAERPQRGKGRLTGGLARYNLYETKDERYIVLGALEKKFYEHILKKLHLENFYEDSEFLTASEVDENREEMLKIELQRIFKTKSAREWEKLLDEENVFFNVLNTVSEGLNDQQLKSRGMIAETKHPIAGDIKQIGCPIKFSRASISLERFPAPRLGEHTKEILAKHKYQFSEIDELIKSGIVGINEK